MEEVLHKNQLDLSDGKNPYMGMPVDRLLNARDTIKAEMEELKTLEKKITEAIEDRVRVEVNQTRRIMNKETGRVSVVVDGVALTHDIPKRVEWDTKSLYDACATLGEEGYDVSSIVEHKLTIRETVYKGLDARVRRMIDKARTEKYGKATVTRKDDNEHS